MALSSKLVRDRLQIAARRFRWSQSLRFFLAGAALSVFCLIIFLTLDAWLHFGAAGRWTGFALTISTLVAGFVFGSRSWRRKVSEAAMARRLEQACSGAGNVLISAVQLDKSLPLESPVRAAIYNEMRDPFPDVQWDRVFDAPLLKRLGLAFGGATLVLFGWAILKPNYFANSAARIFMPSSNIAPLTRTTIDSIIPGDDTVVRGREVIMSVSLGGEVPNAAWVHFREAGSTWQKALLEREVGQPVFGFTWKEIKQPIDYYVRAGDVTSATHRIEVRPKTAIERRTAQVQPPTYTRLGVQTVQDFGVLHDIIPGSNVVLTIDFNNEVRELKAIDENGSPFSVEKLSDKQWRIASKIVANQSIKLEFRDALGVADSIPLQVAVKPDEAPKIIVSEPAEGKNLVATKNAKLTMKFSVVDGIALADVAIYQSTNEKEDAKLIQAWKEADGKQQFDGTAQIPLHTFADEDRITFRVVARDKNDVTGPGVTMSRPVVVSLQSAAELEKQVEEVAAKLQQGLDALIKMQQANLDATKAAAVQQGGVVTPLVEKQSQISDSARELVATAEIITPELHNDLRAMLDREMKNAVLALRNAGVAAGNARATFLNGAIAFEGMILARLQGTPAKAEDEARKGEIADLISGLEDLLKKQRALYKDTNGAPREKAPALGVQQDALADKAQTVRGSLVRDSVNAAIGDERFRKRLAMIAAMFGELKVYEEMLAAAEQLETQKVQPATETQLRIIAHLAKMVGVLNQWQLAEADEKTKELKKEAEEMEKKLDKLAEIQREIVEKTREMARKNDFRPEDIATAQEINEQKDLTKEVIEQMTTDMHAFPDMKPGNEMRAELQSIYEDVQQADKQEVAEGKLKPTEIAVQKEQGILDAIETAKKIAADIEMWLPNKNEKEKWLLENFDKTEMPEIPNLPLADAFEDLVGELLDTQQQMDQDIQDAASNQAFAMNPANGWEVRDGPMPGFGAQGRSGNEKPNHNEQMGRSSGGREGMSDGEMAGEKASNLKGDSPDARRTKDPLQQGQVQDDGGIGQTKATGGGKAGGFSDRTGMEGNAPVRAVKAAPNPAADAAAVKQALLAQKTAKTVAQANLLYIRSDGLAQVAQLMDENQQALKEGRIRDARGLHQRIIGRLRELKSGVTSGEVMSFASADGPARTQDKQLLGGSEGDVPAPYKEMVADYFRALIEEK